MLSPSDFNNAVPQFTNGNYASNPLNPQYIAEPSSTEYNRGVEPIHTLPAQWWNWFMNKFTGRFNKVNVYVKNIFNELSQLLSLVEETPSGTEADPTDSQLKYMFETKYPDLLKDFFTLKTTTVNGHELSDDVTVTKSDVGLGNVANTGDSATPVSGGTTKFTTGGAYTELAKKVDTTRKVNGHALSADVTVTKSDVGLGSVINTGDSATPTSGGTTKFTTGGAYTELAKKAPTNHASTGTGYGQADTTYYGHVKRAGVYISKQKDNSTPTAANGIHFCYYSSQNTATLTRTSTFNVSYAVIKNGAVSSVSSVNATKAGGNIYVVTIGVPAQSFLIYIVGTSTQEGDLIFASS